MKTSFALASTLAADYSKAAFTVAFLGGIVALIIKRGEIPLADIVILIAVGTVITAGLAAFSFFFNNKNNRKLKANDHV
jgi:hypothetical protein